ncbi:DMT family transporter [Sulfitobacter donghicola]|uniref:Peptide ABC transporter permease n=1 Tax=Sulfitobacter donghicola DSW-25 = KCTC 12864 = JCM 14565 TaxID=1300350 RepID=A0A073IZ90_9RHOB|nr:DMT family transporter [Sulfitobacter donghicola]KEJ90732.1 peptide ABC transporter permease [Sulfitobacter donghicola DSW-25 = KCTC 12864 = JCM 14565]KIN67987.1 Membrane protein [Sulfitobacter donghicola DSW-25 = KCTC 12864 = JCM 14565]
MDLRAIGLGLIFALIWSSAFTSARIIVADATPLAALSLRYLVSGVIGVSIARALGQSWHLTRSQWRATISFGILQNAIYLGLFFVAMQTIEASLAAIIASTMPLMVGLAAWMFMGDRLSPLGVVGLLAGVVGVALIMGTRINQGVDIVGVGICFIGVLALTIATLTVRGASSGGNLLMVVGLQMLVGCAALVIATLLFETPHINFTWPLITAFIYTCLVPGLLATWVWFTLVGRIGATRAAAFHFLNPFFGVAIAAVLLGESLGPRDLIGVAIIAAGILAVQISRQRSA